MNFFYNALARRIIIGTLMAGAFILTAFNLHAVQKQPVKSPLKEKTPGKESLKIYNITFFSLKQGHSIAPAIMILYDKGSLEIKLERENILTPHGKYTVADHLFKGDWEFTIQRTRPYLYASHFKGLYLFDTYIIGLFTLKEYIEEQRLTQEIPFVFFATLREKESGSQKSKDSNQNSGASSQK
jgi:hypothetical protein